VMTPCPPERRSAWKCAARAGDSRRRHVFRLRLAATAWRLSPRRRRRRASPADRAVEAMDDAGDGAPCALRRQPRASTGSTCSMCWRWRPRRACCVCPSRGGRSRRR
jgi:hypothetical protein